MKSSSNDNTHPYLRGYVFWSKNRFWKNGYYSQKTQDKYDKWVNDMQKNDKSLTKVDGKITNQ